MQPIRNTVLVKPILGESVTASGIIVPDSFKKDSDRVEIVAVGNGTKDKPMKLKKGDIGYRVSEWGNEVEINGEVFYLMEDNAIIALD
jgi:chaperonin GroES